MPYYGDTLPYYYGGAFSTHSSLMTGTGRTLHSPLGSTRYAPHLTTISESPLSALRRYTPATTMTSRPKRVIDTADIDVSTPRALSHSRNNDQRCRLRRDRPTIRIRSQALKDNPALREHYERHEKTVGELLVEKFLIKEKKAAEAEQDEPRTKLYSQISLEENDMTKKQKEDLQEALQRRITRRMTRRRSSADVQMDTEQLEREFIFAQAQADALDSLVAEEQAEIEVEVRMGTLIRKNLVRTVAPLSTSNRETAGLSAAEDGAADETRTKKLAKKVKKRKKTSDKPSPPSENDLDSAEHDVRAKKIARDVAEETSAKTSNEDDKNAESSMKEQVTDDESSSASKALKFKIEASNSVGDFSTLWINANAAAAEEQEQQRKIPHSIVEQFRDSVRLPAPKQIANSGKLVKKNKNAIVEEHQQIVVLPVKKIYVKDEARNSVYLTLKTPKNANVNKQAASSVTNDEMNGSEALDDKIKESTAAAPPSSTMINGKSIDKQQRLTNIINSTTADTTMGIARQPRVNKVAKFRSKDITQSDVEVKSISELAGAGTGAGEKIEPKDVSLQKFESSSNNDDASNLIITNESISKSSDRDVDGNSTSAFNQSPSSDVPKGQDTNFEIAKSSEKDENNLESENLKSKIDEIPDKVPEKIQERVILEKLETKPLRRLKKEKTEAAKNQKDGGAASSLDSSNSRKQEEDKKDLNIKTQRAEPSERAKILSAVTPSSNDVESLPNASTINLTNVENSWLNIAAKNQKEKSDVERNVAKEDLSILSPVEIGEKFVQLPSKVSSEPVGVANETGEQVVSLGNSRKVENKCENVVVAQPATIESPKILIPTKKDVNSTKLEIDDKLSTNLDKKLSPGLADDKNVVELPKLRKQRKVLALSSRNNSSEIVQLSPPESPNLVTNSSKSVEKVVTKVNKKRPIIVSPSGIDKSLASEIKEKPQGKVENLTNGVGSSADELKTIVSAEELPQPDVKVSKKEEEIDFWGEIKSEKIAESREKIVASNDNSKAGENFISEPTKTEKEAIGDSMVIVLDPAGETKSNTLPESGTRDETKALVPVEKKLNKVKKKKKTSEISGCKKKDEEKASSQTILEHMKSSDSVDEKSHKKPEQLEPRSTKLGEKNSLSLSEAIKIIEAEIDQESERFGHILSPILEESQSPIPEDLPKIEPLDAVELSLKKDAEEIPNISASLIDASDPAEKPLTENLAASVPSNSEEPVEKEASLKKAPRISVPTISIDLVKPEDKQEKQVEPEVLVPVAEKTVVEVDEDEAEDGPGTPTNETVNGEPNNISKWQGLDDLSLDQPDKDIGPEVALANLLKESKKKKVASSKKKTSKKNSVNTNSSKSNGGSQQDSSKKKKLGKKKKSTTKSLKEDKKIEERSGSKVSNTSDSTLKPGGLNLGYSPKNSSGRNSPKQRPLDLIKMFYTTPASLLTATPRDLSKVRRAKVKKRKHSSRTASASSDSTGSTRSTQSTGTTESTGSTDREEDRGQKRISSTRSNDSGFDGSPRLSNCDMACHKKCEKLTGNLCGLNQKLVAEALQALKRAPSQSSDNQRNSDGSDHHASGRITPPATNLPRFKKYNVTDFNFLKVLGKGSFGKVLLAELRRTDCVYAVKCLKKDVVLEDDDVECTLIERKVLTLATRHPYLCHLFCTFQTDSHLFFVMEYLNGGDLMFHIQKSGRFAESRARFYAAEIWSGLNFLHKKGIVYRDLKLDNVLLDFEGHIRIADFGMCKLQIFLDRTADTFCGTPDYMAPEIIKGLKYNQAVDWWSFGVLLYEMLTGQSPFSGCDEDELFWSICNERPFIPRYLSQEAMDVLICLLEKDAGKRPPAHEISIHPFFHALAWERLERRQLEPPFKPALEHTLDTRYFDTAFTAERPRLTPVPEQILTSMDQGVFRGFSYTNPNATD